MCEKYSMSVEALRHRTACPSAAASAPPKLPKNQRSRARSGRLHGRVRHAGLSFPVATRMTVSLLHAITRHDGRLVGTTPYTRSRKAQRAFGGITSAHDHTRHDEPSAPRAVSTTGVRTTPAQRANARRRGARWAIASPTSCSRKRDCRPRSPAAERPAHQLRRYS